MDILSRLGTTQQSMSFRNSALLCCLWAVSQQTTNQKKQKRKKNKGKKIERKKECDKLVPANKADQKQGRSRGEMSRCFVRCSQPVYLKAPPSYLRALVKTTVLAGMFRPVEKVSVANSTCRDKSAHDFQHNQAQCCSPRNDSLQHK